MNEKDGEAFTFLGRHDSFEESNVVVIMAPYEGTVSYGKGTYEGPELIVNGSGQIENFDVELGEITDRVKIHTPPKLQFKDNNPETAVEEVYVMTKYSLANNKFPVILGGEHTISFGAVKAFKERYFDLTVLQIDAHADLRDQYDGIRFSHACVMRRIRELGVNTVGVGIRSYSKEEQEYIESNNIPIFRAPFSKEQIKDIIDACSENVYLTIDADGFDPSVIPATGTPVPGGLLWYDALELFRELFEFKNIVGFDFVELKRGNSTRSEDTAASLIYKLIGYKFVK